MRLVEEVGIIPMYEPIDLAAGADSETFQLVGAHADIVFSFGVLTVPGALSLFSGATAGAKTTALPFTYRLSAADFKAAAADTYGAETAESDGILTLSATGHDHRVVVIHVDAADLPDDHTWVTFALASGTAQFISAVAIISGGRYRPAPTAVPTS
jgi:hypothetical protein